MNKIVKPTGPKTSTVALRIDDETFWKLKQLVEREPGRNRAAYIRKLINIEFQKHEQDIY